MQHAHIIRPSFTSKNKRHHVSEVTIYSVSNPGTLTERKRTKCLYREICRVQALAVGLAAATATSGVAQTEATVPVKNVVLVHGAWVDGSSWSKVIPLLEAKGLHVVSVQIPLTSLADDVAATSRALALIDGPVVLVGHSYGGVVITQAGNDQKVKGLVYIAAFAPDSGESVLGLTKTSPVPSPAVSQIQADSTGFTKISKQGNLRRLCRRTLSFGQGSAFCNPRSNFGTQRPRCAGDRGGVEDEALMDTRHFEGPRNPFSGSAVHG